MDFSSKASTLERLKGSIQKSIVDDLYVFSVYTYKKDPKKIISDIKCKFVGPVVVRSSAYNEDSLRGSLAGHYRSCLNIDSQNAKDLGSAIDEVIASYELNTESSQVFVQHQIDAAISGVILTYDVSNMAPYVIINYESNGETSAVTSGLSSKTIYLYRDYIGKCKSNALCFRLGPVIEELESIFESSFLDIEFGITSDNVVHIFQVRPLAFDCQNSYKLEPTIRSAANTFKNANSFLSNMSFWNPAEMLGDNPHQLDYSLYSKLITDRAWNIGIVSLGYSPINDNLMCKIGNVPYIKLENAFQALVPNHIEHCVSERIVKVYNEIFAEDKTKHDKIEFEIVLSNYTFDIYSKQSFYSSYGLSCSDFQTLVNELKIITNNIIAGSKKVDQEDRDLLATLENQAISYLNSFSRYSAMKIVCAIRTLIDSLIKYGATTFARQARCDFIAKSMLYSLTKVGIYEIQEIDEYIASIPTITSERHHDTLEYQNRTLTITELNKKYGHLRASSYDITSSNYLPASFSVLAGRGNDNIANVWIKRPNAEPLTAQLKADGFDISGEQFFRFVEVSRKNREYFKFIYSKALDVLLKLISGLGRIIGMTPSQLSFLEISDILNLTDISDSSIYSLAEKSRRGETEYNNNSHLILPDVLTDVQDIFIVEYSENRPNFITNGTVAAETIVLDDLNSLERRREQLSGKIVLMERAEPGNDWIFECNIVGLVTMYGGAGSHMAIRCAENGIPAAIGCGKKLYTRLKCENGLLINCQENKIKGCTL